MRLSWHVSALFFVSLASGLAIAQAESPDAMPQLHSDQGAYAEMPNPSSALIDPFTLSTEGNAVPVLVYHIVRPFYPSDSREVRALAQTPEVFDEQMQFLEDEGYHVISFEALERYRLFGIPLPSKPIVLSFDDGWHDQFVYALPILLKHRFTATFFVFTNSIGRKDFFTLDELKILLADGMTIGSHSRSHPYLATLGYDPALLWDEIKGSKDELENALGIQIHEFAYPFGQYTPDIAALVEKAGYRLARGDSYENGEPGGSLFGLGALNAPTSFELFKRIFGPETLY